MNIADILQQHAFERPNHSAIEDGERLISYGELARCVNNFATVLYDAGVRAGDVVCVMLPDSADHIVLLYALAKLGAIHYALDFQMPNGERQRAVQGINIKLLIARRDTAPIAGLTVLYPRQIIARTKRLAVDAVAPESPPQFDDSQTMTIVKSSGTTGAAKQVYLSHAQIMSRLKTDAAYRDLNQNDRFLSIVHLSFLDGSRRVMTMHRLGGSVVINHSPPGPALRDYILARKITSTFLAPGHLLPLLNCSKDETAMLAALKINVESAPLSHRARLAARRQLTPHFLETYGTVETSLLTRATPSDQDAEPDSVGRVIDGIEAQIVDGDARRLAPGEVGEIRFRGQHFPTCYQGSDAATARAFRDGWFYPGDLAAINSTGYVFLKGRSDDVINNEGAKFYPVEVENVLLEHPAVREVAVTGWPHPRFGSVAIAFVVATDALPPAEKLQRYCQRYLAAYKTPQHVIFVKELPRNRSGKILKRQLKKDLQTKMRRQAEARGR